MIAEFIDSTFFSFFFLATLTMSVVTGYYIAHYRYLKRDKPWKASGIENGIIGFYSLLLSFTLLQSGNSNKDRNSLIHQHADAIARVYRESLFLDDGPKSFVRTQLEGIVESKISTEKAGADDLAPIYKITDQFYTDLWNGLTDVYKKDSIDHGNVPELTEEVHVATALDYRIRYSYKERTPLKIMLLLIVGSWMVGLLVGFTNGFNAQHHFLVPVIFILLTGLTVLTICDLDNPVSGLIRPSYENYKNLLMAMKSN